MTEFWPNIYENGKIHFWPDFLLQSSRHLSAPKGSSIWSPLCGCIVMIWWDWTKDIYMMKREDKTQKTKRDEDWFVNCISQCQGGLDSINNKCILCTPVLKEILVSQYAVWTRLVSQYMQHGQDVRSRKSAGKQGYKVHIHNMYMEKEEQWS